MKFPRLRASSAQAQPITPSADPRTAPALGPDLYAVCVDVAADKPLDRLSRDEAIALLKALPLRVKLVPCIPPAGTPVDVPRQTSAAVAPGKNSSAKRDSVAEEGKRRAEHVSFASKPSGSLNIFAKLGSKSTGKGRAKEKKAQDAALRGPPPPLKMKWPSLTEQRRESPLSILSRTTRNPEPQAGPPRAEEANSKRKRSEGQEIEPMIELTGRPIVSNKRIRQS